MLQRAVNARCATALWSRAVPAQGWVAVRRHPYTTGGPPADTPAEGEKAATAEPAAAPAPASGSETVAQKRNRVIRGLSRMFYDMPPPGGEEQFQFHTGMTRGLGDMQDGNNHVADIRGVENYVMFGDMDRLKRTDFFEMNHAAVREHVAWLRDTGRVGEWSPLDHTQVLRYSWKNYLTPLDQAHPHARKVRLEVAVGALGLTRVERETLVRLAGPRCRGGVLKLTSDGFPLREQNVEYLTDLLQMLVLEARNPDTQQAGEQMAAEQAVYVGTTRARGSVETPLEARVMRHEMQSLELRREVAADPYPRGTGHAGHAGHWPDLVRAAAETLAKGGDVDVDVLAALRGLDAALGSIDHDASLGDDERRAALKQLQGVAAQAATIAQRGTDAEARNAAAALSLAVRRRVKAWGRLLASPRVMTSVAEGPGFDMRRQSAHLFARSADAHAHH